MKIIFIVLLVNSMWMWQIRRLDETADLEAQRNEFQADAEDGVSESVEKEEEEDGVPIED